ncbi:hypothetical protein KC669_01995 [Candidatus Dojkabacteria bacterium]|uniref:Uncharacterized protein n=1 Tax=Candidatus Dojkabacteria bacterium TaxID=2099670 RepID=A0A955RL82_9BACT|nr:hypothetical protein [Candidatus Dojkabacteria bacterium]
MDTTLPIIEHDAELGQYFQKFEINGQTYMTVPEASITLTPTANVEVRHAQTVANDNAIKLPGRAVPIFTFSSGASENNPSSSYSTYVNEFLNLNPNLERIIQSTNLPAKAFFAVDLARTSKLICLIPTL